MEKIWLKRYAPGVPSELPPPPYQSLNDLFTECCQRFPNNPAISNMGTTLTYAQLQSHVHLFATYLQQHCQLNPGDRVAIMLPNCMQYHVAMLGTLRAGLTVVNINPLYTQRELTNQLNDSGAKVLIALANFGLTVQSSLPNINLKHIVMTELGDLFPAPKSWLINFVIRHVKKMVPHYRLSSAISLRQALSLGKDYIFQPVKLKPNDIAFLQYTGGTTGVPKGAMLSHGNLLANSEQIYTWVKAKLTPGTETMIAALPFYHIYALTIGCFMPLKIGAHAILITNPRDLPNFVKELAKIKFTIFPGINTLFNVLLNTEGFAALDFSHLKITTGGGMATLPVVAKRWKEVTGNAIIEGYGLTEASPLLTVNLLDIAEFSGSAGVPIPSTDVCIMDEAGKEVTLGEVGELCVKGPQVMQGYWLKPEETEKVFFNGWLKTGDIAKMDAEGFIYIVDRKKDMIDVSGFKVFPNEIEAVISEHPKVREVAVIGIPDPRSTEAVKAFVVKKDESLTEAELRQYFEKTLTPYKRPKEIEFRKELPKSNVGKILRRELRDEEKNNH